MSKRRRIVKDDFLSKALAHSNNYMTFKQEQDLVLVKHWMDRAIEEQPETLTKLYFFGVGDDISWPFLLHYPPCLIERNDQIRIVYYNASDFDFIVDLITRFWPSTVTTIAIYVKHTAAEVCISKFAALLTKPNVSHFHIMCDILYLVNRTGIQFPNITCFHQRNTGYTLELLQQCFPNLENYPYVSTGINDKVNLVKIFPNIKYAVDANPMCLVDCQKLLYLSFDTRLFPQTWPTILTSRPNIQQSLQTLFLHEIWSVGILKRMMEEVANANWADLRYLSVRHDYEQPNDKKDSKEVIPLLYKLNTVQFLDISGVYASWIEFCGLLRHPPVSLKLLFWQNGATWKEAKRNRTPLPFVSIQYCLIAVCQVHSDDAIQYSHPRNRSHYSHWCRVAFLTSWYRANRGNILVSSVLPLLKWFFGQTDTSLFDPDILYGNCYYEHCPVIDVPSV